MPWQGWDERKVRPQRQAETRDSTGQAPALATMGFTAINSSSPVQDTNPKSTNDNVAAHNAASYGQPATVASAYLGRGVQEQPVAAGKSAPKKATTKGKKRTTTGTDSKANKRRKTSNVSDVLPATKSRTTVKKQSAGPSKAKDGCNVDDSALQHEQPSVRAKKSTKIAQQAKQTDTAEIGSTPASSLVSVIVPSTSMSSLQGTAQQTSFEAARSSSGHGSMLYNSSSSPAKQQSGIRFSQPLFDQARGPVAKDLGSIPGAKTQDVVELDEQCFDDEDDDFGTLFDELAQQIERKASQGQATSNTDHRRTTRSAAKNLRRQPTPKARRRGGQADSLIGEDDELAEAMILAEKATKKSIPTKRTSAPAKQAKQLPTPTHSAMVEQGPRNTSAQTMLGGTEKPHDDAIMIDSDDEDEDMIELDKAMREAEKMGLKPRLHKQNVRSVDQHEDYGGALLDDAEKQLLEELKNTTQSCETKSIVRNSFPQPALDRSPIFGAANTTLLRTCFRLGEALNVGSHAVRTNKNVILEIYARVASSFRDGRKQHFLFRDLYHAKPPHLEGDFELWSQSRLWDLDGKAFLKAEETAEGMMCRAVARMKRDGTKWRLEVLSIWEAGWEDVEAVAGIYASG